MDNENVIENLQNLYKYIYISVNTNNIENYINTNKYPIDKFYFSKLNKTGITDTSILNDHIKKIKTNVYFTKLLNLKKVSIDFLKKLNVDIDDKEYKNIDSIENLIELKEHMKTYILPQILLAIDNDDINEYIYENTSILNKRDNNLNQLLLMSDIDESNINSLKYYSEEDFKLTDKIEEYILSRSLIIDDIFEGKEILI